MPTSRSADLSLARFSAPRYWPTWALWLAMRCVARLPTDWQQALGVYLGRALRRLPLRQVRTARRNLELCFPELSLHERAALLRRHFEAVGLSFVDMAIGWFLPIDELLERVTITGREHLDNALACGKGVLLVSAHFTPLEVGVAVMESLTPLCSCMYRPQRNAMIDVIIRRGRSRFAREQIPRDDVRALLRSLRDNHAVLYMPDQTYLGRQSALLTFFGEPAVTNTATSRLAGISGAVVSTYFFRRLADGRYRVDIGAPLDGFPSGDTNADTRRLVAVLEDYVRLAPEQYLWIYKKFKGRPPPHVDPYS